MSRSKDSPMDLSNASVPKTAMKGFSFAPKHGTKPISFATKATSKPSTSSTLGKRPRAALHDGSEDEEESTARHEAVTGFDIREGGALKKKEAAANGPLVIPRIKNRDWREEIRQNKLMGKNLLPPEVQAQRSREGKSSMANGDEMVNSDSEVQWGLTIRKIAVAIEQNGVGEVREANEDGKTEIETTAEDHIDRHREMTADELAIEALMGAQSQKKGPDLVIPTASNNNKEYPRLVTEEDAYRRAVRSAPEVSTLEDYERVPVEEFGAALLRGMGWKEGDEKRGTFARPKDVKRRQNLLGLGATELKGAEELGAWVQKSDPKRLGSGSPRGGGERRPRANEYRERKERKRESRDEKYGGSHRSGRDDYMDRERDRDQDRDRDRRW